MKTFLKNISTFYSTQLLSSLVICMDEKLTNVSLRISCHYYGFKIKMMFLVPMKYIIIVATWD